jgi:hypothetical protein
MKSKDWWTAVGEDRSKPLLQECSEDNCRRFIIPTKDFDLFPRILQMTCSECFENFLVNLDISEKVKERLELDE